MLPPDSVLGKKILDKLDREEKKIELEIKKAAKAVNKQATSVLTKWNDLILFLLLGFDTFCDNEFTKIFHQFEIEKNKELI